MQRSRKQSFSSWRSPWFLQVSQLDKGLQRGFIDLRGLYLVYKIISHLRIFLPEGLFNFRSETLAGQSHFIPGGFLCFSPVRGEIFFS